MRRRLAALLLASFLAGAGGCRNCDLVEAELRTRENDVRELRAELANREFHIHALNRELSALHQSGPGKVSPEQASQIYSLKQITLARQTGGYDDDDAPGDEALHVVIEPKDADGHAIKAPGTAHIEAYQVNSEGLKSLLCGWDVSAEQLRRSWKGGLFMNGYFLVLHWRAWPETEKIRVSARFNLTDGRVFEADRDVTVKLTPPAKRKSQSPSTPAIAPAPPSLDGPLVVPLSQSKQKNSKSKTEPWWSVSKPVTPAIAPIPTWRPSPAPSLAESVQLLRPMVFDPLTGKHE